MIRTMRIKLQNRIYFFDEENGKVLKKGNSPWDIVFELSKIEKIVGPIKDAKIEYIKEG